jgi:hypothetical protein
MAALAAAVVEALDWAEIQIGTVTDSLHKARRALLGLPAPGEEAGPGDGPLLPR